MASWRTDIRSLTRGLLDRGDAPVFGLEDHPLLKAESPNGRANSQKVGSPDGAKRVVERHDVQS